MSPMPADLPPVLSPSSVAVHAAATPVLTAERGWDDYRVKAGDTLYDLARTHDTTVAALAQRNGISNGRWIRAGDVIQVPGREKSGKATSSAAPAKERTVTVRPGDTLSHIALRYDVSVAAISKANGLANPRLIHPGQKLTIPGTGGQSSSTSSSSSSSRTSPATSYTVTIRPGDTLSHIAAREGVSLAALTKANPSLSPRKLWVGQQVTVPGEPRSEAYRPDNVGSAKKGEKVENTFLHYTYSDSVSRSAAANREYLAGVPVPGTADVKAMVVDTAKRHGVDPKLMLALSYTESGWSQRAVSPANAIGIMQVIPSSGDWASSLIGRKLNLLDPQDNVTAGTVVMRALLRAADNEDQAIAGYYQGLHGVRTQGMYPDTKNYVATVKAVRGRM